MAEGKEKKQFSKKDMYEAGGESLSRKNKACPRCGPGIFLANHQGRLACGKCGYTEFQKKE
jgi:small subunit ribosomal protein S27Ae